MIDVLRREDGDLWRFVCLIDGCGYATRPLPDRLAASVRKIHRHTVGRAPIPWSSIHQSTYDKRT